MSGIIAAVWPSDLSGSHTQCLAIPCVWCNRSSLAIRLVWQSHPVSGHPLCLVQSEQSGRLTCLAVTPSVWPSQVLVFCIVWPSVKSGVQNECFISSFRPNDVSGNLQGPTSQTDPQGLASPVPGKSLPREATWPSKRNISTVKVQCQVFKMSGLSHRYRDILYTNILYT